MELRFYHDPDTDLPHIYNHGVTEQEVRDVLNYPLEDAKSAGDSRIASAKPAREGISRLSMCRIKSAMVSS